VFGVLAYLGLDVLVLWTAFFAVHAHPVPGFGIVLMAYIIGALGGSIPLPASAGTIGGIAGMLIVYGVAHNAAIAAVLLHQAERADPRDNVLRNLERRGHTSARGCGTTTLITLTRVLLAGRSARNARLATSIEASSERGAALYERLRFVHTDCLSCPTADRRSG
jgi:hypothetical protein